MPRDSRERFSDRVGDYVKYRPSYPLEIVSALESTGEGKNELTFADIGSGTGIFSKLLLKTGHGVIAVEPNGPMREAAEEQLSHFPKFQSIAGDSENTGLPDHSVDIVTAAQAFHWFRPEPSKREFQRILKPEGKLALIWNERLTDSSPFLRDYEQLLIESATDYNQVNHANIDDSKIEAFFAPHEVEIQSFSNSQHFDYQGLKGRCTSSSYVPAPDAPSHERFFDKLEKLFDTHQSNGFVDFEYCTKLYLGRI